MRTTDPITCIGYRADTPQILQGLLAAGILRDFCCQKHDRDTDAEGKLKDPHFHCLLYPAKMFDTVVWAERTKRPNGTTEDGKPRYDYAMRFDPAHTKCRSEGAWFGYSVLHDPACLKPDDADGKEPYSADAAVYGLADTRRRLESLWAECEIIGVHEDADLPAVKAAKKSAEQKKKNRSLMEQVIDLVEQGETDWNIMYTLGKCDIGTQKVIAQARIAAEQRPYDVLESDLRTAHAERERLKDLLRQQAAEIKRLENLVTALQAGVRNDHVLTPINPVDPDKFALVDMDAEDLPF